MPGDCCECGACCFSDSDTYVPVSGADLLRLGGLAEAVVRSDSTGHYLRMSGGRCSQLEYMAGSWVCAIYTRRPQTCRSLSRGSPACLEERSLKRLRVKRAALQLSDGTKKEA